MGLFDAFVALSDIDVEVVAKKQPVKKVKKLKEALNEKSEPEVMTINISGDDMYEKGQAYYYAHTGDKVDYKGKTYEIIVDKEGKHKIGYSDTLLLKDVETGEEIEVSKKDFIAEATLLKECKVTESQEDYWVLSDGKNPKNSSVFAEMKDLDGFIKSLEDQISKNSRHGHWELLHYVKGKDTKVWDSEKGRVEESCELKEEPRYDLGTEYDARKSFYGKAKVDVRDDGSQVLYSYGSPVCQIKDGKAYLLVHVNGYASYASSQTTLRHVKEFLKQNGFKADSLKQMEKDYPIQRNSFVEAKNEAKQPSKGTKLVESEIVDLNKEEDVEKGKEILNASEEESTEQIVDVDADTVDKLKDSYIGNTILQCPVCRTLIYKKPDALVKAEESELYNVGELCPHCGSEDGYELVGQVAPVEIPVEEPEQTTGEQEVTPEPTPAEEPEVPAEEGEEKPDRPARKLNPISEPENESLLIEDIDETKFDKLVNQYLVSTYNNVESYSTTRGTIDETGEIVLEGVIKYTSGKEKPVKFEFVEKLLTKAGKVKLIGINEELAQDKKAFTLVGTLADKCLSFESMAYNYSVKVLEESKTVRGRVNLKTKKLDK